LSPLTAKRMPRPARAFPKRVTIALRDFTPRARMLISAGCRAMHGLVAHLLAEFHFGAAVRLAQAQYESS